MPASTYTRTTRILLGLSLAAITVLSLVPVRGSLAVDIWDKAQHAGAYVYLTLLTCTASPLRRLTWRHVALLMVYGLGIEVAQAFLPWRSFSLLDMVANASGIALGWAFAAGLCAAGAPGFSQAKKQDPSRRDT
ncbi:VanZ family protein [Desulfoluna butyratoxydans]|uniref:Vanz-like n=1 Tax=Desulfoluna butyratoxydans TaxID=231438 RepID=A0A4U8YGJ1_9BACT|nr:VanZ family protein [Desulfoluna butyratoxydans]VFQ42486.1 vanz-like [Desulfoluna butyratoxydans]